MRGVRIRLVLEVVATIVIALFVVSAAQAKKGGNGGGNGGGKGGGGDEVCTDQFPSFTYLKPRERKSTTDELYLSSSEGCFTVKLADIDARQGPALSYNNGLGLVAWIEGSDYDLWIMRFSVDPDDGVAITTEPELMVNTEQPEANGHLERFFGVDVWTDYSDASSPIEIVSLYSLLDFAGDGSGTAGRDLRIKLVDLPSCTSSSSCEVRTLASSTIDEALDCMGPGPFDPSASDGQPNWRCLIANGTPKFSASGDALYFRINQPGIDADGIWRGTVRVQRPADGWWPSSGSYSDPQLVFLNTGHGSIPSRGQVVDLNLDGSLKPVIAAHACIGMSGGVSDCRIYFLDVEACMADPHSGWQRCQAESLYTGQIAGFGPSWWISSSTGEVEVIYYGWGNRYFDTIRAFDPTLNPIVNDRQLISKGHYPNSAL